MSINNLPSLIDFNILSAPDSQHVACSQDGLDIDAVSRRGRSTANNLASQPLLGLDTYVPANYIWPEAYALLAAAVETPATRHTDTLYARTMDLDLRCDRSTLQNALFEEYDPERILPSIYLSRSNNASQSGSSLFPFFGPPKKYFRAFWLSISFRLLRRWAHTARPTPKQGPAPTRQAGGSLNPQGLY